MLGNNKAKWGTKRMHDWLTIYCVTRALRGAWQEAMARWEAEAPADGSWWHEKRGDATTSWTDKRHVRQCHNERCRQMGGSDLMRGNATTSRTRCLEKSNARGSWRRITQEAMCFSYVLKYRKFGRRVNFVQRKNKLYNWKKIQLQNQMYNCKKNGKTAKLYVGIIQEISTTAKK